jgi:CheY-like chemotaxis protein
MHQSVQGLRVVVLGSEKSSVAWLKKSLIRQGALVSCVDSPKKALKLVRDNRMHVLIVDDDASMDIAALIHAVRALPSKTSRRAAAILLSSHNRTQAISQIDGFQQCVQKPISLDGLIRVIEQAVHDNDDALPIIRTNRATAY